MVYGKQWRDYNNNYYYQKYFEHGTERVRKEMFLFSQRTSLISSLSFSFAGSICQGSPGHAIFYKSVAGIHNVQEELRQIYPHWEVTELSVINKILRYRQAEAIKLPLSWSQIHCTCASTQQMEIIRVYFADVIVYIYISPILEIHLIKKIYQN